MRKLIIGCLVAGVALAGGYAIGQIVPALPFQLQNNTVADATQVMANFNQLLNSTNANAAKNGSNSDITALLGLTTPLAPGVGGTTTFTGGTSTGSANAQVVATVVPSTFSLTLGSHVVFVAGFSNTGAGGFTLNVAASGAKSVLRRTQVGTTTFVGGEIRAGDVVTVVYDGSSFQLEGYRAQVGEIQAYTGALPEGWAYADGTCVSSSTYSVLLGISGSWNGACGGATFGLPDYRGRAVFARDNQGTAGAANRLTAAAGCTATSVSVGCGAQTATISQAQLPAVTWPQTLGVSRAGSVALSAAAGGVLNNQSVGGGANVTGGGGAYNVGAITVSDTQAWSVTGGVTSGGSGTAMPIVPPLQVANIIVKL